MASNITSNLDENFPVAGVDNNTQGFRENFSVIKTSLTAAYNEITEIQNKAIFKSNLTGDTLDNNMGGNNLVNSNLVGSTAAVERYGVNALASQILEFGNHYHVFEISTNTNFVLSQFPQVVAPITDERLSQIRLELNSAGGAGVGNISFSIFGDTGSDPLQIIYYNKLDFNISPATAVDKWSNTSTPVVTINSTNNKMIFDIWSTNGKTFYITIVGSFRT
jgi:hypothetical protein